MEYVPGVPITDHCDQKRLKTRERLELFVKVCEGVPHAHQILQESSGLLGAASCEWPSFGLPSAYTARGIRINAVCPGLISATPQKHLRLRPPLCALADEADGIAVDEVVPPRVVSFLADEVVIAGFSPMSLRRANARRRQDPEA